MEKSVAPVINHYWIREEFPHDLVPGLAELGIAGLACEGYGCPGGSSLLDGMIALELARVDPSIATFMGVHGGLAMGSIYLCGSEEQKQRWLPAMARMEKIGAFALTEPDVGSGVAGGLTTTAQRDGDIWVLNGQKKWIGNATFADHIIVWARDVADNQVKGFVVEGGAEGFSPEKMQQQDRAARRAERARSPSTTSAFPEENRLQEATSFRDTAKVLRLTRAGVAWQATGCARGAYEHALAYAKRAPAVRPADRRIPARPGPAGQDAVERHRVGLPVRAAVPAAGPGPGQGPPLGAGQGVLHGADARDRRLGPRAARRQRDPA